MADEPKPAEKPVSLYPTENICPPFNLAEVKRWLERQGDWLAYTPQTGKSEKER